MTLISGLSHAPIKRAKFPAGRKFGSIIQRPKWFRLEPAPCGPVCGPCRSSVRDAQRLGGFVDQKKQLEDERLYRFSTAKDARIIDFAIVLKASDGDVVFGDTKEVAMGIRVPTVLDVASKKGGHIENSEGQTDDAAWGKPAMGRLQRNH